ncbi:MAG: DUF975 family protein [Lachnospiraceae bacterium]|nr:DUF975 family protein [Lachnospiraceae bacterium]
MNWTISEVKQRGKATFKAGYWKCVLVAFIIAVVSGGFSTGTSIPNSINASAEGYESTDSGISEFSFNSEFGTEQLEQMIEELSEGPGLGILIGVLAVTFIIVLVISLAISIFLLEPLLIGCHKFFKDAGQDRTYDLGTMGFAFSKNYLNIVKIMFLVMIKVFLWTLLLIIPGIIKSFEYRMIPYILMDNPDISSKDAFARSKELMNGNKWHSFLLDLSFIGWVLLGILTCGILLIFYVEPYMLATDAELYLTLNGSPRNDPASGNMYGNQTYGKNQYYDQNAPANGNANNFGGTYTQAPPQSNSGSTYGNSTYGSSASDDAVNTGSASSNDTPAFGDERNKISDNDKPFNTPY